MTSALVTTALNSALGTANATNALGIGSTAVSGLGSAVSSLGQVGTYVAGANYLSKAMNGLSELVEDAMDIGETFEKVYKSITKRDFPQDVRSVFSPPASHPPETIAQACDQLSEDIKKGFLALHNQQTHHTPITSCNNGSLINCTEEFINTTNTSMNTIKQEIDSLECQLQGKKGELGSLKKSLKKCGHLVRDNIVEIRIHMACLSNLFLPRQRYSQSLSM